MSKYETYFLTSRRLGFRRWHADDLDIAIQLWGDYEVTKYFDARGKWPPDAIQERLGKEIQSAKKHGVQYWPIFLLTSSAFVGCCGLRPYDLSQGIYEIGFHIRSNQWCHGYGHEAAVAVMNYAFNKLNVKGLFAGHNPQNTVSQHLVKQLGFRYTHDEYYPPTGLNHPSYVLEAYEYFGHKGG